MTNKLSKTKPNNVLPVSERPSGWVTLEEQIKGKKYTLSGQIKMVTYYEEIPSLSVSLEEGFAKLNPDLTYDLFNKSVTAKELSEYDFSYLPWLDQVTLIEEINRTQSVSVHYHPKVLASLAEFKMASPYWGKHTEALTIYLANEDIDESHDKTTSLEIALTHEPMDSKKNSAQRDRTKLQLQKMGYKKERATTMIKKFQTKHGTAIFHLKPSVLAKLIGGK